MEQHFKPQPVEEVMLPPIKGVISKSNLPVDLIIKSLNPHRHWAGVLGYFDVVLKGESHTMRIKRKVSDGLTEFLESVFFSPKEEPETGIVHHMNVQLLSGMYHDEEFFDNLDIEPLDPIIEFNIETKIRGKRPPKNYPGMDPSEFIDWGLSFFDVCLKRKVKYIRDKWVKGSDTFSKFMENLDFRNLESYSKYEQQATRNYMDHSTQTGEIQTSEKESTIEEETREFIINKYFEYTKRLDEIKRQEKRFKRTGQKPEVEAENLTEEEMKEYNDIEIAILSTVKKSASAWKYGELGFTNVVRARIYEADAENGRTVISLFERDENVNSSASE